MSERWAIYRVVWLIKWFVLVLIQQLTSPQNKHTPDPTAHKPAKETHDPCAHDPTAHKRSKETHL